MGGFSSKSEGVVHSPPPGGSQPPSGGSASRTGGAIHSQGGAGSHPPAPNVSYASNVITIPTIPGWDRIPTMTQPIHVEFTMKGSWGGIKTSMDTITSTIMAGNTAGAGYKLAAVFLPVTDADETKSNREKRGIGARMEGHQKKGFGKPLDGKQIDFSTYLGRAMCIFQKDPHSPNVPLETLFLQAPMTITAQFSMTNPTEITGYQGLYGGLSQAGHAGYPLSCIIDEPNTRCNGLFSTETNVHVVCQRPQGIQVPPSQYLIASCPIKIDPATFGSRVKAAMPNLISVLSSYTSQGYKIGSVYNPPTITHTGWFSTETQVHIVLVKTPINYYVTVCDVPFLVSREWRGSSVDHNQYLQYISSYAAQGWELAGLIDLPDSSYEDWSTYSSTIKLIFQAAAGGGGCGGYLSPYSVDVTVPEGAMPGSSVPVTHPSTGIMTNATVPQGVPPGGVFKVQFE